MRRKGKNIKKKIAGWFMVGDNCRGWRDDCDEFSLRFGIGTAVK